VDSGTNKKLDKDRFRFDLGGVNEAYAEVRKRITESLVLRLAIYGRGVVIKALVLTPL
jgi:hypothetical protein